MDLGTGIEALINRYGRPDPPKISTVTIPFSKQVYEDYFTSPCPKFYIAEENMELLGLGITKSVMTKKNNHFTVIKSEIENLIPNIIDYSHDLPNGVGFKFLGGFAFFPNSEGIWSEFGAANFVIPKILFMRKNEKMFLTLNYDKSTTFDNIYPNKINDRENTKGNQITKIEYPISKNKWSNLIKQSKTKMEKNVLKKVVLARTCKVTTWKKIDIQHILKNLGIQYPKCYKFLFEPTLNQYFFGASPELLCIVMDKMVKSIALAGTSPRGSTNEEDQKFGDELLLNKKELYEHQIVVKDIVKKLESIGYNVNFDDQPSLLKLKNLQHLNTKIEGTGFKKHILEVIKTLHPTAAMGGHPNDSALDFIKKNEPLSRGYYASPLGWFDLNGNGKFIVGIRSALNKGHKTWLYGGAGIVSQSNIEREWEEIELKFQPILKAMEVEL